MTTSTLGTNATSSIPLAIQFFHAGNMSDQAALSAAVLDDSTHTLIQSASVNRDGYLFVPRRGFLRILEGDWVGVTSTGWPILLSKYDVASGLWTHNP